MVASAPSHSLVVAIVPKGSPGWLRHLTDTCGFMPAPGVKAILNRASRDELPACVLGPPTVRVLGMFQSLREAMELPERPLLVLLSEYPAPGGVADYVWPPDPEILLHNLESALAMRRQWRALHDQRSAGVADDDFDRLLELQRRTSDELELLKTTVINNVAHELRTPLLHLKGAITLMGSEDHADQMEELYGYAVGSTARLEGIISNITMLADAFGPQEFEPVYLPDSLDQAMRNLKRSWAHKANAERVTATIPPHLPMVHADRRAIGIVLQLLIDNALKFSEKIVEVEFTPSDAHVQITVRDHGIGIAPEQHERIFQPFVQADGSSTRRYGGIGVGLAIARRVVEHHGGRIIVHSTPKVGSEFLFSLPLSPV